MAYSISERFKLQLSKEHTERSWSAAVRKMRRQYETFNR